MIYGIQWDANANNGVGKIEYIETIIIKYLIQNNQNLYSINNSFYPVGQTPTKELFDKFGTDDLTPLTQTFNKNNILMQDDGAVGVGKQFSCDLSSEMLSLNNVNVSTGTAKYLIQDNIGILYTLDTSGNIINSPSQTLDESNYLTNGFDNVLNATQINQLKSMGDITNYKLLMYTDNTDIVDVTLNYNCDEYRPIDKTDEQFKILMYKEE